MDVIGHDAIGMDFEYISVINIGQYAIIFLYVGLIDKDILSVIPTHSDVVITIWMPGSFSSSHRDLLSINLFITSL